MSKQGQGLAKRQGSVTRVRNRGHGSVSYAARRK